MAGFAQTPARRFAITVLRTLRGAGHVAYLAGGCVRDELLGERPKDYDVATDAAPERVGELFPRAREVGRAFGVMMVGAARGGPVVEVATFRREGAYSDNRRPDAVEFCTAEEDAHRRDFTINALFLDPLDDAAEPRGRVIDHVGGLADLEAGIVRAVGDPEDRLAEDHLRALRAVRFAARLGFEIEPRTAAAITAHAAELAGVSPERVGDEVRRMLDHPRRADALRRMEALGLATPALGWPPERRPVEIELADRLPPRASVALGLAAWLVDRLAGGADSPAAHVAAAGARVAQSMRRALVLTNDEVDGLRGIIRALAEIEDDWPDLPVAAQKRLATASWFADALALAAARDSDRAARVQARVAALAATPGGLDPDPWVTGDDLIAAGLEPGPGFRDRLDRAYDAQLDGRAGDPASALRIALQPPPA